MQSPIFIQRTNSQGGKKITLSADQRVALNRQANQLFNKGRYEDARRIFLTTHYSDGLIRMAEHYLVVNQPLEALRMFWLAPERKRFNVIIEKISCVIRQLLEEEGTKQ